jgi:selenocysteine-specific elongation factor
VIVGTAGHIDHGKTTLVQRLTGVDTDRLPEEKRRGITIVLGFAPLLLPDGTRAGVVDVPGHERFVKNMVAGAGGIDVALFVVAADEGVMPQTREHLEICQLLGITRGVVALTKIDRAGRELAEVARADVESETRGTFLDGAPIVLCSAVTGEGIDVLLSALVEQIARVPPKALGELAMLPIDRVFSMKGFGSIVTGTLLSGSFGAGDLVEVLPSLPNHPITEPVRVRGLHVFHEKVDRAYAGERSAINLAGVDLEQLALGQVIYTPGAVVPTQKIAVELRYLKSRSRTLKSGARVLFHAGTALVEAGLTLIGCETLEPGETAFAHVLLREPVAVVPGQHFIARGFDAVESAGRTIAGGLILDPHPGRRKRKAPATVSVMTTLAELARRGPGEGRFEAALLVLVEERGPAGLQIDELARRTAVLKTRCAQEAAKVAALQAIGERIVARSALDALGARILELIDAFHAAHPYKAGMAIGELSSQLGKAVPEEIASYVAEQLIAKKQLVREAESLKRPQKVDEGAETRAKVLRLLESGGLEPPAVLLLEKESALPAPKFRELLTSMIKNGDVINAGAQIYFSRAAFEDAKTKVLELIKRQGTMSAAQAKELLGVSRKFLIPLLEAMDKAQVTARVGDVRKARR